MTRTVEAAIVLDLVERSFEEQPANGVYRLIEIPEGWGDVLLGQAISFCHSLVRTVARQNGMDPQSLLRGLRTRR